MNRFALSEVLSSFRLPASGAGVALGMLLTVLSPSWVDGASHSDAPLIKQDPQANITDVYAFVGARYNDPAKEVLNVLVSVRPFSDPGDGVIYERFADDALYSIHIAHPDTGATVLRYDFTFSDVNPTGGTRLKNPDTILSYGLGTTAGPIVSIGDGAQNYTQVYTVRRNGLTAGTGLPVPPPNVGGRTTPFYNDSLTGKAISGAGNFSELDSYTQQALADLSTGEAVFCGPREDGFYADTPAIFDLLDDRILDNNGNTGDGLGQDGGGVDGFKGFNVLTYALQIPIDALENHPAFPDAATPGDVVVGVYASVSRRRLTIRPSSGDPVHSGAWIQVNRMGNPLFNEALVPLRAKDRYNRTSPTTDNTLFRTYALNPELATLINLIFGTNLADSGRTDIAQIYIPDVLRVVTSEPVRLPGQGGFSRLSFIGFDVTAGSIPSGWPNGRRIGDDVVDIALTALSGPVSLTLIGDNVAANDQLYNQVFPYLGTPHAGPSVTQRADPGF
ncbi:MAG TPA: DUF4331 domain-containing protein [Verrucomicrobiales bacterium]|nr:DUF4331 domain-containing protein [Verrucomicrobiales bacterium]